MGSASEVEQRLEFDVGETIFVAVGTNVCESEAVLFWAVQNFQGKRICVLHVHQPSSEVAPKNNDKSSSTLKEHVAKAFQELERQKLFELLDRYLLILAKLGVQAQKVWIEMKNVERGIVEVIALYSIRWLVMGSEAKRSLKRPSGLKSKKAFFVCQQAPVCCHIWFVFRGHLIHSRGGNVERSDQLLLRNSGVGMNFLDAQEKENSFDGMLTRSHSQVLVDSKCPNNGLLGTPSVLLSKNEGENDERQAVSLDHGVLEEAVINVKCLKSKIFDETEKLLGAEDDAMRAKFKAKSLEILCAEEVNKTKKMTGILEREKQEVERMNGERNELLKELNKVQELKLLLERQASKHQSNVEELEEKMFAAVELLISFKEKRDKLRIEYRSAMSRLRQLKNRVQMEPHHSCTAEMLTFSFMEINEATGNFDPSWKIGAGRHGSVYKGRLCHMDVAIKMLPSYGSHSQSKFQYEVEALSRVRHPNLVSIVGTCPESRSVVYENMKNGSLEDRLACKDSARLLPWQIRTRIAADICSTLIFLHYNEPCFVHGDLKLSKILLDANFVAKLGALGISHLIPQEEKASKQHNAYMDPEYLETGKLTPESDIYSFGVILLQILTGRSPLRVVKDVKCALENEKLCTVLDLTAGDWPPDVAEQMAAVALRCCEEKRSERPDLVSELWSVLEPMRSIASAPFSVKKHSRVPAHFTCPIFQEIMKDPLIAADGFTYEADAIRGWFKSGHDTSPMTNLKLEHSNLLPNYALLNAIQEWQHQL